MKIFFKILVPVLVLPSCVNFTNMQSARTLGDDRKLDHYVYTRVTTPVVDSEVEGVQITANYTVKGRINNRLDWGTNIGLDASATGLIKFQFLGNNHSKIAASIMPETGIGFFPLSNDGSDLHSLPVVWKSELPLIATYHFSDHFYISTIPKFLNYYTPQGHFTMAAATTGIQFGKKVNWTMAYSYFKLINNPPSSVISGNVGHIFEIGLKFNLFTSKVFAPRFSFD